MTLRLRAGMATDAGRVRTSNQDRALVVGDAVVVADGMGGHAGGEIAAATAVEAFARAFHREEGVEGLRAAADAANREVFARAERDRALRGMGTTLTAAAIVGDGGDPRIALINIGDSRAYLFEHGQLTRLTDDHSLVEEMVRRGEITAEAALTHPHRHILTRALGIDPGVDIDSWLLPPVPDSRLLLCSDGLTNECSEDEIAEILGHDEDPQQAADTLVERALYHGGSDNITVIVADLNETPDNVVPIDAERVRRSEVEGAAAMAGTGTELGDTTVNVRQPRHLATTAPTRRIRISAPPQRERPRRQRPPRPSREERRAARRLAEPIVTPRVALFSLLLVAVLGGIAGFVIWFNRATYYVGVDGNKVAIYQGRPGGFLFFKPTLLQDTPLLTSSVLPANLPMIQSGILESSYDAAKAVVKNLTAEQNSLSYGSVVSTTTTTIPTTTTTALAPTTTTSHPSTGQKKG